MSVLIVACISSDQFVEAGCVVGIERDDWKESDNIVRLF